jgi:hypothetical protein
MAVNKSGSKKKPAFKPPSNLGPLKKFTGTNALMAIIVALLVGYVGVSQLHKSSAAYSTVCNFNGYCLNRWGGGTANNTPIIAYPLVSNGLNEHFGFVNTTRCGTGKVTSICPFVVGSGFNAKFINNQIQQIKDFDTGKCLGSSVYEQQLGTTSPAALVPCGSADTYFVHNNVSATKNFVEDISWTNLNGKVHWLCDVGNKHPVTLFGTTGGASCQWL